MEVVNYRLDTKTVKTSKSKQNQPKSFYSIEFFPPKTPEGREKLQVTRSELAELEPAFFSVTFGAGGTAQKGTFASVKDIMDSGNQAAPHLSCIGSTKENIRQTLKDYQNIGVKRIVALRGDVPSAMGGVAGEFRYANELVEFIRTETGNHFHIEVAAYPEFHPQATSAKADLENFKRKVEAGANSAITQYFFNPDAYAYFVENCAKLQMNIPIVPGIMPITNYKQLARFSDLCGAEIPKWIRKRLEGYGDDLESIREFGLEVVVKLCEDLKKQGAPGMHFYCMNKTEPTKKIWKTLALES